MIVAVVIACGAVGFGLIMYDIMKNKYSIFGRMYIDLNITSHISTKYQDLYEWAHILFLGRVNWRISIVMIGVHKTK